MSKKKKKITKKNLDHQKEEKLKRRELRKNKIDKVNFATIVAIMILLPLWQLVRMQFAWNNRYDLYQQLHCGYILWGASIILLITYIINLVKKRSKIGFVDIILYIFTISSIISVFLADDKNLAIFGSIDRYEGILTLTSYSLIILTIKNLNLKQRFLKLINLFIGIGIFQSFVAIIQCFVRSEYILKFAYEFMANSLCGNPNYLGSYMMLLAVLCIGLYIFSEKYNTIYFILANLFIFTLVLAQSSAPLFGLALGILFIIIFVIVKHKDKIKKTLLATGLAILVSIASIYGTVYIYTDVFHMQVLKNYTIKSDITQLFNLLFGREDDDTEYYKNIEGVSIIEEEQDNRSTPIIINNSNFMVTDQSFYSGRLFIWNVAGEIIKEHFWFGCGPDNFAVNFQKHSPLYIDRAHNVYVHLFTTLGLFGFISYMALLIYTFTKGLFAKNKITIVCLGAFFAYITHAFFSVNVIEVVPYFYILTGIILANNDKEEKIYD